MSESEVYDRDLSSLDVKIDKYDGSEDLHRIAEFLMQLIHHVYTWSFATTNYYTNLHMARIYIVIYALDV